LAVVKLFVDSADPTEIGVCVAAERTTGATTSAAHLAEAAERAGGTPRDLLRAICQVANGPVTVEVGAAGNDRDGLLAEARGWMQVAANVVVRLPPTAIGLEIVRLCAKEGIRTAVSAAPGVEPALAAARAGAAYVTSLVGRVDGVDGNDVIRKLLALFRTMNVSTEIVAGGIHLPTDVIDAAIAGAHVAAAPPAVLRALQAESTRIADMGTRSGRA
jgi:transaldolase